MVVIRLARGGSKKRPFYRVMVADKRNKRDGRAVEQVGYFNPLAQGSDVRLKLEIEKIEAWVGKGAQLSERVSKLVEEFKAAKAA